MLENKISVIVPVFKTEKYLDRCIESIVNQTYENLEIILVDDGSPDACPEICDKWEKKDNRIKVIHKKNEGVLKARLDGVGQATGKYVGFVDSDDWIDDDMYEYLVNLCEDNNAQVASAALRAVDLSEKGISTNQENEKIHINHYEDIFKRMNTDDLWSMCQKIYLRKLFDVLPKMDYSISVSEDMMVNCLLYKNVDRLVVSNQKKYNYFRHAESAIAGVLTRNIVEDSMKAYNIIDESFDKNDSAYQYQMANKIKNDFFLINSIIRNNKCMDRYGDLRNEIIKNKDYIFKKDSRTVFSKIQKIGVILLAICPKLYNKSILMRREIRGF